MSRLILDDVIAILTIRQEAEAESFEGKVAVAEVIWRRTQQKYNSNGTVIGTCLRAYQFSGWNTSDPNRIRCMMSDDEELIIQDCKRAWKTVQEGSNITNGALLYYNPKVIKIPPDWVKNCDQVVVIGNHTFYKPKVGVK